VDLLLKGLHALVDQGNSVIVIEHDADMITQSDWVIELGPEAGAAGGTIVYEGVPHGLVTAKTPWGAALKERIAMHSELLADRAA
jgi:excinuclease ABC subunit A